MVGRVVAVGTAGGSRLAGSPSQRLWVALGRCMAHRVLPQALLDGHVDQLVLTQAAVQTVFLAAYCLSLGVCRRCSHFGSFISFAVLQKEIVVIETWKMKEIQASRSLFISAS